MILFTSTKLVYKLFVNFMMYSRRHWVLSPYMSLPKNLGGRVGVKKKILEG